MSAELIGTSNALCALRQEIDDIARSEATVLIVGESGVGKDIVARRIHWGSGRTGPFVTINCGGVPDSLLESELFGHVRGSFTGAFRNQRGWLERAGDGTFFLDEVGEMSPRMQASLLRFVENREIQRVGSNQVQKVGNVRLVAATNRDLSAHVADGRFREDLFYRLNVIHIVVPPLRERLEDVPALARHFLDRFATSYQLPCPTLSEGALAELARHTWPGNVRELSNVIERLVVRNRGCVIGGDDVLTVGLGRYARMPAPSQRETCDDLYERMVKAGESFWSAVHDPFTCHDLTRADLRALIARGLEQTKGNYRSLLTLFNAREQDYKRFVTFLAKHGCRVPGHRARPVPISSTPAGCQ